MSRSLQETYAPKSICFGCGPANTKGLKIRSFASADGTKTNCEWMPEKHHEAFPGMLNGGIIGALLDCHSNWTAAWSLMVAQGLSEPPCTVTADYSVQLMQPTPSDAPVQIEAWVVEVPGQKPGRALIEARLSSGGQVCATCRGTFVAVKPGHPAYHRWG